MNRKFALSCSTAIAVGLTSFSAFAQSTRIEEIVVTARGRAENLQQVPDSITAFSSNDLRLMNAINFEDVAARTPGVHVIHDQDPGTNIITIRGVSTDRLQQASVAYVVDGLSLGDKELFTQPYYDLERVEILKGPQGALYGKNAIGGVFNIVSKGPTPEFEAEGEAEVGNGGNTAVRAAVGGPIAGDKLQYRIAINYQDWDGWIYNTYLQKNVDYLTTRNLRLKLRSHVTDNWTLDFAWNVNDEDSGAAWLSSNNITGLYAGRMEGQALTDPFGDYEGRAKRHWYELSLKSTTTFSDGGTLSAIAGYDEYEKRWSEELDFRNTPLDYAGFPAFPAGIQPILQPVDLHFWTGEVRYTSADNQPFRYTIGAFAQDTQRDRVDDFGPLLFGGEPFAFDTPTTQLAVFGQGTYAVTDRFDVTAALRYDNVDTSETISGTATRAVADESKKTFDALQPKVSLAYQATRDAMLYASASRGFKPGGFNPQPGAADTFQRIYSSETTTAYEAGAKTSWLDGRLTANAAAFYTDYSNFQYFAFINGQDVTYSADEVKVKGVELALEAMPSEYLSLDASYAYTDSEIQDFQAPDPITGIGLRDYSGNQTPNSPKYNLNLGGTLTAPINDALRIVSRVDVNWRGKMFFEVDNALYSPTEAALNMRVALESETWSIAAWGKNITDNRWAVSAFGQGQVALLAFLGPGGPFDSFNINRGRQYGVTVAAKF